MPHIRKSAVILAQLALLGSLELRPVSAKGNGAQKWIQPDELRFWLTYFASDELEGRAVFSEGLGLAAAYTIIDAHGGRLTVANRADRGAIYKVELPAG